ncbi:MAG: hypothetical protein WAM62_07685, partial [Pseudolabrys sp.]
MDAARIIEALEQSIAKIPEVIETRDLNLLAHYAASKSARAIPEIIALLNVLNSDPALAMFDGATMHVLAIGSSVITYVHLAAWLMRRTKEVGAAQAVQDLENYLNSPSLRCQHVLLLCGLTVANDVAIGSGISLISWENLPNSSQKKSIYERVMEISPIHMPTAAIVSEELFSKSLMTQQEFAKYARKPTSVDQQKLHDALMCVALTGPHVPKIIASWVGVPGWTPIPTGAMAIYPLQGFASSSQISPDQCIAAAELFSKFAAMAAPLQVRLRLSMQ